ncbi:YifB family Mg chelatase-like AAA ATPase [Parafrankia soli]|uniref:YifB family Mg chelatase-like AAA ATPase n=1 Tax=Parafrankia soli TaxID=2599596 RepID=UPI000B2B4D0E|nr:ATP-binding protein [Parafrankia soli]
MDHVQTRSIALVGAQGYPIDVEAAIGDGSPRLDIIGFPDDQAHEIRDRLRAAVFNSGIPWPHQQLTIGLFPATMPKASPLLDLPIAAAILAAAGILPHDALADRALIGELGLDGRLLPGRGVLPAVLAAVEAGIPRVVVPTANATEAALAPGVKVEAVPDLTALVRLLQGQEQSTTISPAPTGTAEADRQVDLADVPVGPRGRLAAEVAAAGGHHLFLTGGTGSTTRMLADRIPGLLPPLMHTESLEVTALHSAAGVLPAHATLITRPPWRAPHHSTTAGALFGSATRATQIRPGIVSQAHRGLLLLADAPEFTRSTLQGLWQPLSTGRVEIPIWPTTVTLPAAFLLVLTSRPCPCPQPIFAAGAGCACAPRARHRYLTRIPAPIRDHCHLRVTLPRIRSDGPHRDEGRSESTAVVAARVAQARQAMATRLRRTP